MIFKHSTTPVTLYTEGRRYTQFYSGSLNLNTAKEKEMTQNIETTFLFCIGLCLMKLLSTHTFFIFFIYFFKKPFKVTGQLMNHHK